MKKYGIIGNPLEHSYSPKLFAEKFSKENITNCVYQPFELKSIKDLQKILKQEPNLKGFNVTSPFKKDILSQLYEIDQEAINVWSVNTVKVSRMKGRVLLKGFNTDTYGFMKSLTPLLNSSITSALVLGTGGAASAVVYCLKQLNISVQQISRQNKFEYLGYEDLNDDIIHEHKLIINTTPLGTYPKVNTCPDIPYEHLTSKHLCYDLVYNPEETLFLKKAKENGAQIKNGLEMLQLQAEKAWEIWR
ncbi:MAG: shikimate dehydrogenase [Bacteroidetes bacterium]|nr:shikimate dehydrogenase [Bacteroidota bacterium]